MLLVTIDPLATKPFEFGIIGGIKDLLEEAGGGGAVMFVFDELDPPKPKNLATLLPHSNRV
jgi:hypothetical protein